MSHTPRKETKDMTVCDVGLPLAGAFARHLEVFGYRRNQEAVDALNMTVEGNFLGKPDLGISVCGRCCSTGGDSFRPAFDQEPGRHERGECARDTPGACGGEG